MIDMPSVTSPPSRILIATDLSPRCDRALDRSIELAQAWHARLVALNVFDAPKAPDLILQWAAGNEAADSQREVRAQLSRDLSILGDRAEVRLVRSRSPSEVIDETAKEVQATLVVTGVARDEPLGRFLLGSTVERLARTLQQPLLIVRNRPRAPYRRVVAATDLAAGSQLALVAASAWFPSAELHLFHAYEGPGALTASTGDGVRFASPETQARCERWVSESGIDRARLSHVVAVEGRLEAELTRYVRRNGMDLAVMGGHESVGLLDALLGSSLDKLLLWVPCDVLVVPAPG